MLFDLMNVSSLLQEMERSADVLAAGLLEVSDPTLSSKFFLRQVSFTIHGTVRGSCWLTISKIIPSAHAFFNLNGNCCNLLFPISPSTCSWTLVSSQTWMEDSDGTDDSILKHKPLWASYGSKRQKDIAKRSGKKKQGDLYRTYGTRVVPVWANSSSSNFMINSHDSSLINCVFIRI